jgi:eukaryotic-like serine/threonine-protein kinase
VARHDGARLPGAGGPLPYPRAVTDFRRTPATPTRVGGRYVLRGEIGRGGMATVHRARDEVLDRDVAIKLLHAHLATDPAFLDRFRREARAAAALAHPNVVTVHDWGETDDDGAFLVLQYVDGCSLREVLRRRGRLTPAEALAILGPAAEGLGAAHTAGLVHRDVKPENVLLAADGTIQITDFGLARAAASATSTFGADVLVGSPHYLSPEAVRGEPLRATADVYALGVVLFECLTGRPPHEGDSPFATAVAHTARQVPPPSDLVDDVPPAVDEVVRRACAPEPEQRLPDGAAFASALATAVPSGPAPVLAAPGGSVAGPLATPGRTDTLVAGDEEDHPTVVTADDQSWDDSPGWVATGVLGGPDIAEDGTDGADEADLDEDAEDDVEERHGDRGDGSRPRRRRGWIGLLIVVALLAASAAGGYLLWDRLLAPVTAVPAVDGAAEADAVSALEAAGFEVAFASERPHSLEVPAGHVLAADPGDQARQGSTITLTLSDGPRQIEVPDVAGEPAEEAAAALREADLEVAVNEAHDEDVAEGLVASQDPSGGVVDEGTTVELVVSLGPRPIEVPSLGNLTLEEARAAVSDAELSLEVASRTHHPDVPSGSVISQQPEAGATLTRGETVEVVVSEGPEPIEVPNLRGDPADEAIATLEGLGFEVEVERRGGFGAFLNPGQVFDQNPAPGAMRRPGDTVTLFAYED